MTWARIRVYRLRNIAFGLDLPFPGVRFVFVFLLPLVEVSSLWRFIGHSQGLFKLVLLFVGLCFDIDYHIASFSSVI